MLKPSFHLGTIAGISIGVHYTWFIIFFLLNASLFTNFSVRHEQWSDAVSLVTATATTLLFFASIILHELGHSLVAIARGIRVQAITLFIFGGVAQITKESTTATSEFLVAIAGPVVSFILAGLFYLLKLGLTPYSTIATEAFGWLATINLMVAVFNLVPGFPLDGGRIFRALVWGVTGDAMKGMQWAVTGGKFFAYFLMLLGLLIVLQTGQLLNGLWMIGIGWFLLSAAEASGRAFVLERLTGHLKVGDIMQKDVPTIAADVSIRDWMDETVLLTGQRAFFVERDDRIIGLVTLSDAVKQPRGQWSVTPVHAVMTSIDHLYMVEPSSGVLQVLQLMDQYAINQVPVAESGHIIGWITRQHLLKILQTYSEAARFSGFVA